ncbi:MAG: hypothetical protein IPP48_07545 [Chitinophagaceae bacterium]|nr:hypothetical protein [Chitinophagaceae bacterium]
MKQIFTTITLFFLFILVTVSFTKKNKHTLTEFRTNSDVIECLPEGLENLEGEFEDFSSPDHASKVRRNISSLNNAQIQQIRDAIERMKKEKFKVFKNKNITVWDVMVMTHNGKNKPQCTSKFRLGQVYITQFFFPMA